MSVSKCTHVLPLPLSLSFFTAPTPPPPNLLSNAARPETTSADSWGGRLRTAHSPPSTGTSPRAARRTSARHGRLRPREYQKAQDGIVGLSEVNRLGVMAPRPAAAVGRRRVAGRGRGFGCEEGR